MIRTLSTLLRTAAVTATSGITFLHAQSTTGATVPFTFHVKDIALPAGNYEISPLGYMNSGVFGISDHHGHAVFVSATPGDLSAANDLKLTFLCHNGACQLAKFDSAANGVSYSLLDTKSRYRLGLATEIRVPITR